MHAGLVRLYDYYFQSFDDYIEEMSKYFKKAKCLQISLSWDLISHLT